MSDKTTRTDKRRQGRMPRRYDRRGTVIAAEVARRYGLTVGDLRGPRRTPDVAHARMVAIWITQKVCGYAMTRIGGMYGGRDHTTVLHAVRTIKEMTGPRKQVADELLAKMQQHDHDRVPTITQDQLVELSKWQEPKNAESLRQRIEAGVNELRRMRGAPSVVWPE